MFPCGMCILFTGQGLPTTKLVSMCHVRKMPKHVNMCFSLGTWVPKCSKVPHETPHSNAMLVPHQRDISVLGNVGVINVWAHVVPLKKENAQVPKLAILKKMHKCFCTPNVAPAILTLVHLRSWRPKWMCNPCLRVVVSHLFAIPILLCKSPRQQDKDGMMDQWRRRLFERDLQKGKIAEQKRSTCPSRKRRACSLPVHLDCFWFPMPNAMWLRKRECSKRDYHSTMVSSTFQCSIIIYFEDSILEIGNFKIFENILY